jgi:hypothetical protein
MNMLRWSAIVVGAVSLFSLLERLTAFMLAPDVGAALGLYRSVIYPFVERFIDLSKTLAAGYHIRVPILPLDFVILYALVSLAIAHFMINQRKALGSVPVAILLIPVALVWPVIVLGNIVALCVSPKLAVSNILFGWDMELAKVIATCLAILGANFYLLT